MKTIYVSIDRDMGKKTTTTHTLEYYAALPYMTTWMDLKGIILVK